MRTRQAEGYAIAAAAIFRAICLVLAGLGLGSGTARAQAQANPAGAQPPVVAAPDIPDGSSNLDSLSIRYRLVERYALATDPAAPEILSQYQVATRETQKLMRERSQGTPERSETIYQVIYTERPAKIANATGVTDTVRRYETFRMQPARDIQRLKVPLLEKLNVWYRGLPGQPIQVFSLTEGRPIREWEYNAISSQVFLPQLITLLPATPKRVGDTWRIPRNTARALLGVMPQPDDYDLTGTLKEVRKGPPSAAIIEVKGLVMLDFEPTAVNARLSFSFDPKATGAGAADAPAGGAARDQGVVEARGSIDEIRMALARSAPIPEGDGRLKQTVTREVIVARRPSPAGAEALAVPTTEPVAKAPSSWLTYDSMDGQFHFRHPQGLALSPLVPPGPDEVNLMEDHPTGPDVVIIKIPPPIADAAKDRQSLDPDYHRRQLAQEWAKQKEEILPGPEGWLPEATWAPLKRKVYRIEAALKPKGDIKAQRVYLDHYLVVFERNRSIVVEAMTTQDPHLEFRDQVEEILKSFDFGTSDGSPPPTPARPRVDRGAPDAGPRSNGRGAPAASAPGRQAPRPATGKGAAPRPRPEDNSEPSPFPQ